MTLKYISYGGGVQSTCIVLMAIDGQLPKPDLVVFSDTGSETPETYVTVQQIKKLCEENNIRFEKVASKIAGEEEGISLHDYYLKQERPPFMPMVTNPRCTFNFKIYPVRRFVKTLVDTSKPKPWAISSLGITVDESSRIRKSDIKWCDNDFPLIDKNMTRQDCKDYIKKNWPQINAQKSGCFCCPYQGPKKWAALKRQHPSLFAIALDMERTAKAKGTKSGIAAGRSIEGFNSTHTLEDFGFELTPEVFECGSGQGGCFL